MLAACLVVLALLILGHALRFLACWCVVTRAKRWRSSRSGIKSPFYVVR
jgi:hypothetical protein